MSQLREKRKSLGLCSNCGGELDDKHYLQCSSCRAKNKVRMRGKYSSERARARRELAKEQGLCCDCGSPLDCHSIRLCLSCLEKSRKRSQKWYDKKSKERKQVALFSGRFQPPHLGHIITLMKLHPQYDEIIIAITEYTWGGTKMPVLSVKYVKEILEAVFKNISKYRVIIAGKAIIERTNFDDLPRFDVILTGDLNLIKHLEKIGMKYRFIPRTEGVGYSGTELREVLKWG